MRRFNLKAALAGKPVVTRDGRAVTQLHLYEQVKSDYPVRAVIENRIECYTDTGYSRTGDVFASDLLMAAERKSGWYDNIPEDGVLCKVKEYLNDTEYTISVITHYYGGGDYPYQGGRLSYAQATPLTLKELQEFTGAYNYENN